LAERDRTAVHRALFPAFDVGAAPSASPAGALAARQEAARRDGFETGRQQGQAQALAAASVAFEGACAALEKAARELAERREAVTAELEAILPRLVIGLAQGILRRELAAEPAGAAVVRGVAAALTRPTGPTVVRVSPRTADALDEIVRGGASLPAMLTVERDLTLGDADWILDTGDGLLDGRLGVQLEEAARLLMEPTE
jgi:flagellar biosynthesis/type III secretory pathway protein FliH